MSSNKFYKLVDGILWADWVMPLLEIMSKDAYEKAMQAYNSRPHYPLSGTLEGKERYELNKDFVLFDSDKRWWAVCENCKWEGSSEDCGGGHPIADTGDYDDCYCPKCGSKDLEGESIHGEIPEYEGTVAIPIAQPVQNNQVIVNHVTEPNGDEYFRFCIMGDMYSITPEKLSLIKQAMNNILSGHENLPRGYATNSAQPVEGEKEDDRSKEVDKVLIEHGYNPDAIANKGQAVADEILNKQQDELFNAIGGAAHGREFSFYPHILKQLRETYLITKK